MRKASTTNLAASVAIASALAVSSAQANLINYSVSGPNPGDAEAAEQSFLNNMMQDGYVTEGFEGYDPLTQEQSFVTDVGTFSAGTPGYLSDADSGTKGACDDDDTGLTCDDGLAILDSDTSPFSGRFAIPEGEDNNNWLDSMDYNDVTFDVAEGNNAVGFFMTDPNDQGGIMDIVVGGESQSIDINDIFGGSQSTGAAFYLSFWAEDDIDSMTFIAGDKNDGYGIDNVSVGRVPAPGTLALMGLGLVGLVIANRKRQPSAA